MPAGRIVPTIFVARSLHEAGLADHPSLGPALDFLTEVTLRSVFGSKEKRNRVVEEYHAIEGAEQTLGRRASYVTALPTSSERKDLP
ncbi:MAG: hypothetical protein ACXWH0_12405 [Acidimicrobiia bacterium]